MKLLDILRLIEIEGLSNICVAVLELVLAATLHVHRTYHTGLVVVVCSFICCNLIALISSAKEKPFPIVILSLKRLLYRSKRICILFAIMKIGLRD